MTDAPAEPTNGGAVDDQPRAYSVACSSCGVPMGFDVMPENRLLTCPVCGGVTMVPTGLEDTVVPQEPAADNV